ncbi:MAG: metallophosphoesterase family protein [Candidatus Omnitrophica bacterium]|nr:metallophosphoesterase family protein [Candidatus Omnitrophota bacterium]MDD5352812.1 metallophosphoesterase family protein [Candidatus Omnitrophota bacterium]MDD5550411.1 metallophosphoesterase family protein [Candidatus Omnitrophota bacterium]
MRYAIFSDIHSNLEALQSVLAAYERERIDKYLCIGDIVGYAANPKECIKIIKDKKIITVAGNHDWAAAEKFNIEYFNPYAKAAVLWTKDNIDEHDTDYLNNLDLIYTEDDFCLAHGTLFNPGDFDYIYDISDARDSFKIMDASVCFVGHTHISGNFIKDGNEITYNRNNVVKIEPQKQYIVNVGSVGQPRDRDNRACFCIFDTKDKAVEIKRTDYNIRAAQKKIINAGLPLFLSERLESGQ